MKRTIIGGFFAIALLFVANGATAGTIEYYGARAGLFKACKGDLITVCKRVTTGGGQVREEEMIPEQYPVLDPETEEDGRHPMPLRAGAPEEFMIVEYDGVQYQIPASRINLQDGSIIE